MFNPGQGFPGRVPIGQGMLPPGRGMPAFGFPPVVPMDGVGAIQHLLEVCGLNPAQRDAIMNLESVNSIEILASLEPSQIKGMAENLLKLSPALGRVYIGTTATTNLKALVWWIRGYRAQGLVPQPVTFNVVTLQVAKEQMNTEKGSWDALSDE
eukprot:14829612-Ditylum_brightwellii.AAC.1